MWHDVAARFDREHFHLIAPDLAGYGKTAIAESGYCAVAPALGFAEETRAANVKAGVTELADTLHALVGRAVGQHRRIHLVGFGYVILRMCNII